MKRILVISAFIFTISGHAMAQEASSMAMPFLSIDRNAATAALGGARVTSALYNPAALPFSGSDTQLSYQLWAPQSAKANHINLLSAFRTGEKFGFSVKLAYQMATPYNIIDKNGKSGAAFTPADLIIGAGVGFAFNRFLSLGLQVCYTDQKLGENINASAIAADLFLLYKTGGLKASAGVSRLGTPVKSGNYSYSLPASAKAGASYGFPFGLSLSADFDYYFTGGMGLSEINEALGPETAAVFSSAGFTEVAPVKDYFGKNRFVIYKKSAS